jgi:hypothetical protein
VGDGAKRVRAGVDGRVAFGFLDFVVAEMARRGARDKRFKHDRQVYTANCGLSNKGKDMTIYPNGCRCITHNELALRSGNLGQNAFTAFRDIVSPAALPHGLAGLSMHAVASKVVGISATFTGCRYLHLGFVHI